MGRRTSCSRKRAYLRDCWMALLASDILFWSPEYFGVPVEEFDEAYLSAKSSQESQDARLPQTHEFGGRTQDRRGPPAPGPQAPGSLSIATQQTHASDRLARVREGIPPGHRLQGQALLGARFSQRARRPAVGPLRFPKGRQRGNPKRRAAEAQRGVSLVHL